MHCDDGEDAPGHDEEEIRRETSQDGLGEKPETLYRRHGGTSDDYDVIRAAEEGLHRCVVVHGTSSAQTQAIATDLVVVYNRLGMKRLSENDIKGSLRLLQKAQLLTDRGRPFLGSASRRLRARAVTLNNLGCLMRKWGKPRVGIALLARALRIEATVPGAAENPAGTHLNMSAALSAVGMHRAAAAQAGHAVGLASEAINLTEIPGPLDACGGRPTQEGVSGIASRTSSNDRDINGSTIGNDSRGDHEEASPPFERPCNSYSSSKASSRFIVGDYAGSQEPEASKGDAVLGSSRGRKSRSPAGSILAIAYFNLAVEREHLGQQQAARATYEHARVAADWHLGSESPVSKGIKNALESTGADGVSPRGREREIPGVASFPSIGKLRLCPRSNLKGMRPRGSTSQRSRLLLQRQTQDDWAAEYESQSHLTRAYETPRPRPPPRQSPGDYNGRFYRPRQANSSGPRRAGRWTSSRSSRGAQSPEDMGGHCPGGGTTSAKDCRGSDEDLLWRALACSDWGCSPREARQVQLGGQMLSDRAKYGSSQ